MRMFLSVLAVAAGLGACASYDGRGLRPGVDTEAEVRQLMGEPAMAFDHPDRSRQLAYPRGPLGVATYMVHLRPDGRLRRIEQVLDEEHFARIVPGQSRREDVRLLLGPAASSMEFPRLQRVAWTYRFRDRWGYLADFSPLFDRDGMVVDKVIVRVEPMFDRH